MRVPSTPARVQDLLARHPRPTVPAQVPWEMSAASVISPFLPNSLPVPTGLINRLGRIHLSPHGLAIDQKAVVPWPELVQVHTRPAFELVTETLIDRAVARALYLVKVPGKEWAADLVAQKAREAVMSVLQVALSGSTPSLLFDIPVSVVYRAGRRKQEEMTPGVLSTAFLALPGVSDAILHTATLHGVPVIRHPAQTWSGADRAAQLLADRLRSLTGKEEQQADPPALEPAPRPRRGREYQG